MQNLSPLDAAKAKLKNALQNLEQTVEQKIKLVHSQDQDVLSGQHKKLEEEKLVLAKKYHAQVIHNHNLKTGSASILNGLKDDLEKIKKIIE